MSIAEANWPASKSQNQSLTLQRGSIVFVRYGTLQTHGSGASTLVDPNHVLVVGQPSLHLSPGRGEGGCTIFRFDQTVNTCSSSSSENIVALSSPAVFLRQWHTLCWSRTRPSETRLIERAASRLRDELCTELVGRRVETVDALMSSIKATLNMNGATPTRLEDLADELAMSQFTVSHAFHRKIGISIRHYFKRLRLRKALQLMLDTEADLGSTAMELGFFDQAHFSNAFRQDFGVAPSLVLAAHRRKATIPLPNSSFTNE